VKWTAGESHPDFRLAIAASYSLTSSPVVRGPAGSRTRTTAIPERCATVTPQDHSVAEVGIEPTDTRLSTWPLCLFAYPAMKESRTQESHLAAGRMRPGRALARPQRNCEGRSRTGIGRRMKPCWNHSSPLRSQYPRQDSNLRSSPRQGDAVAAGPREHDVQTAETEGVEPSPWVLEAHCSPRSTSL
jgi:hypothetical protein